MDALVRAQYIYSGSDPVQQRDAQNYDPVAMLTMSSPLVVRGARRVMLIAVIDPAAMLTMSSPLG